MPQVIEDVCRVLRLHPIHPRDAKRLRIDGPEHSFKLYRGPLNRVGGRGGGEGASSSAGAASATTGAGSASAASSSHGGVRAMTLPPAPTSFVSAFETPFSTSAAASTGGPPPARLAPVPLTRIFRQSYNRTNLEYRVIRAGQNEADRMIISFLRCVFLLCAVDIYMLG